MDIREGIAGKLYNRFELAKTGIEWESALPNARAYFFQTTDTLLSYLKDNNVVKKVDRELPDHCELVMCIIPDRVCISEKDARWICDKADKDMLKANWVAVEEL